MRIACCQLDIVWENKAANYDKVRKLLAGAELPSGSLVVLPEMFPTGFSMNVAEILEGSPAPTEEFLREMAGKHQVFIVAGMASAGADGRARNQCLALSPQGQVMARYDKIHPFTLGGESQHYAAGSAVVTFDWQGCLVAPFICYDLRFPEVFRTAVARGAQLFTVIANWPIKREAHWVSLLQARAIENQAYVVGVNRCGTDPKFLYSGRSMIVDPHGRIQVEMGDEEGLATADLDLVDLESWRKDFPALKDRHWKD